ncbi:MAG: UrcA family protein [Candidatus Azotimanducaceae bacterium]|jgi:UrcA family protein
MKLSSKSAVAAIVVGLMTLPIMSQAAIKSTEVSSDRVVVTYKVEDLKSAQGRATLENEIRSAASEVCGNVSYTRTRSLSSISKQRSCYHKAVAGALTDLSSGEMQVTAR